MGPGAPKLPRDRDGKAVMVTLQPGGAEMVAAVVGWAVGLGEWAEVTPCLGLAASFALPLRTQLNFTVAIDFTASNGEHSGGRDLGSGTGWVLMGAVLQGCHRSPRRCTTPAPTS